MNSNEQSNKIIENENYYLQPGYIFLPETSITVSTVIGSGVCVCLYDKKNKIGGMNHFQYPFMNEKGKTTPLYGNVATTALIRMLLERKSKIKHLEAQIFGGAYNPELKQKDIGRENIEIARKILVKARILIISKDVGGQKGRKIAFNTQTNEIAVLKVNHLREQDWFPYKFN